MGYLIGTEIASYIIFVKENKCTHTHTHINIFNVLMLLYIAFKRSDLIDHYEKFKQFIYLTMWAHALITNRETHICLMY